MLQRSSEPTGIPRESLTLPSNALKCTIAGRHDCALDCGISCISKNAQPCKGCHERPSSMHQCALQALANFLTQLLQSAWCTSRGSKKCRLQCSCKLEACRKLTHGEHHERREKLSSCSCCHRLLLYAKFHAPDHCTESSWHSQSEAQMSTHAVTCQCCATTLCHAHASGHLSDEQMKGCPLLGMCLCLAKSPRQSVCCSANGQHALTLYIHKHHHHHLQSAAL